MTTVEKRRSSRKSGSHRKHNDSGYSDTETDREVSSLTDRAFRSLCIGDEAVYNDSDLSASPCKQRDRQLAASHNVQEREYRDRQELKRTAHENFSLRLQKYGQDWMYQGSCGADIHKDEPLGLYGERGSQERLSATFQHSFVEAPQQEPPLRELSLYSNGATEVSTQQGTSDSGVSSLIRAFNSDGQQEAVYNNETSWDKSALMSIEQELSEFSYQQNMNATYFPSSGLFLPQNTKYCSSELTAISQINPASSFMRAFHSKQSMSTQVNCNSNFFIHSEFSPFKVWRNFNRFPFHRGQVSGFMPSSEFSKWYETPMYKELSLQPQQPSSIFQDQGMAYQRNMFAPPMNHQRSTSTSTMMQRASVVEKRCDPEVVGHYRKRAQSMGANRLPSQRPSTASPSSEMSRRVRDTISSVKSLQQKIKMMAEQNIETQSQGVFCNSNYLTPYGSAAMVPSLANNSTVPYNMMQRSPAYALPNQQQVLEHHAVSPEPIEHAPVRAESRGATPDIKMSSYKSRAASLLYNLKDNRKRVKSTYSPSKSKSLEAQEKYKQEPKDFIIDVPEFSESGLLNPTVERGLEFGQYGYQNQAYSPGMLPNSQQVYLGQDSSEYYRAQLQGEAAHQHGFTGFSPEYYTNNQLANGQNPYENISLFTPYKHSMSGKGEGNYVNRQNTATDTQRFSAVGQSRDYVSKGNSKQIFNEAVSGEFTGVDRYNQLKENKYDYDNVCSQDTWGPTNSQEMPKSGIPPAQNYQNINAYQRTNAQENVLNCNCEPKPNLIENYGLRPHGIVNVSHQPHQIMPQYVPLHTDNTENPVHNTQHQPETYRDIYAPPMQEYNKGSKMKENYAPHDKHKYYDQESKKQTTISSQEGMLLATVESDQRQESVIKENRTESLQPKETNHFENSVQNNKSDVKKHVISTTNQAKDGQVPLQQHKTAENKTKLNELKFVEERSKIKPQQHKVEQKQVTCKNDKHVNVDAAQNKDVPTPEEQIKQLRVEKSEADPHELEEVTDKLGHMIEGEPERPEPKQQLIMEYANAEELKEEPIKCELVQSSEQARIEQVKSEASCKEMVETEQAKEPQIVAEHVRKECTEKEQYKERCDADQSVKEQLMENQASAKLEKSKTKGEITAINNNKEPIIGIQKEMEKVKTEEITKADKIKNNNIHPQKQQVENESDKVEQAKTELAKAKAELAKIKEKMKGKQKVQKEEENINQVNSNANVSSKEQEPVVVLPSTDQTDRGADNYELIREKYSSTHATTKTCKTSTTDNVGEPSELDDKPNTNPNSNKTSLSPSSELTLGATESKKKTKTALYDNPIDIQYVYSESSKDFKLSAASNVPENAAKSTNDKNYANILKDVLVEKEEKSDACQQRDATKQLPVERKLKAADQSTGASKEMSFKGLTQKERAQTKQEILTSKIKAHAEKEISAIKEGFAIRDVFKMSTKPLPMSQNINIRQKPPSQEAGVTPKVLSPPPPAMTVTANSQPEKQMKSNVAATEKAVTVKELSKSETSSIKSTEKQPVTSQVQGDGLDPAEKEICDEKRVQLKSQDKLKQDNLDKGATTVHENRAPSLQLVFGQNETTTQDDSLKIVGIMVTVRERNREEKDIQEELSAKCHNTDKHDLNSTGDQPKVQARAAQDDKQTKQSHIRIEADSMAIMRNRKKSLTERTTEKIPQQESETQLPDYVTEKVVPLINTIPTKNKVLAETQPPPEKQDVIAEEPKDYTNKTFEETQENSVIKEAIGGILTRHDLQPAEDIDKVFSKAATSHNEKTQIEDLHIDSIAIRVVPAATGRVKTDEQRTDSNGPGNDKETIEKKINSLNSHQESASSNDAVQNVLSSVRKHAQLLKSSNQHKVNNATNENTGNDNNKIVSNTGDETKEAPIDEGYFQVQKRDREPQNIPVGETLAAVSNEHDLMGSLSNSYTVSSKSLKDEKSEENSMEKRKTNTPDSSAASPQAGNMRTSKQEGNTQYDLRNKSEKLGAGYSHHIRRNNPTTKERQRGFQTLQQNVETVKVEVKPKPKVPIPEISAIADYARLKVIVSQDNEDPVQQIPPDKREGFFPLIQSRHSRRPLFTADSQEVIVKHKSSQNKSDALVKLSKEPKPVVFPITEKEHQRTGMFKLGDTEKTDPKDNKDCGVKVTQERNVCQMEQTKAEAQDKTTDNKEKNAEKNIKHMLEKSRATQAEEEKRAAQREEEQRAREREAIAMQIRERRKKQQETEGHTDNERKTKVVEQQILKAKNEEKKAQEPKSNGKEENRNDLQQQGASSGIHEKQQQSVTEQSVHSNLVEQQSRTTHNDQQRTTSVEEQCRDTVMFGEQQRKAIQENQYQKVVLGEQQRKSELLDEQQRTAAQIDEPKKRLLLEEQERKAALIEEQKRRAAEEEQQRKRAEEEQQRKALLTEEQRKRASLEEQHRKAALDEQRKMAQEAQQRQAEEQKKKAILEEQQRKDAQIEEQRTAEVEEQRTTAAQIEEQKRRLFLEEQRTAKLEEQRTKTAQEDQQRKIALKEKQRRAALEEQHKEMGQDEQQRKAGLIEEQKRRAALEEQQRNVALEEQNQRTAVEEEQKKAALKEEQRRAALIEQQRKMSEEEQERKAFLIEEQKKTAALEEQQRKAALEEQKKRTAADEQRKRAILKEEQRRAALEEQQRKMSQEEQQRKAALIEEQKRAELEEQQRKAALEEQKQRSLAKEQQKKADLKEEQRRAALIEQQRKMAKEEQQRKAAFIEEQKKRAALEEQQRKAALEEQKKRAAAEEQRKKAILKEEQRRAALEEQQRKMAEEEQERKAAFIEEQKKKAALEEQQRKAALEEQKKRAAAEEQRKKAILKEEQRRAALEEQQRKMAEEEQERKALLIEEQKRAALEEQQRNAALEEQKQKAAAEEQRKRAILKEEQRRAALEEQQRKMSQEEQQRKALLLEEQRRRAALEEQQRKAAQAEQLRKTALNEEQKRREEEEEQKRATLKEQKQNSITEEQKRKDALEKQRRARQEEEERRLAYIKEERIRRQIEEEREAQIEEQRWSQQHETTEQNSEEVKQTKDKWKMFEIVNQVHEQSQTHIGKDTRVIREQDRLQREMNIRARHHERATNIEEQKNLSEKTEDLQYYSLTSAEAEKPSPPQQKNTNRNGREKAEDSVSNRPHALLSPALSLPRSSASSPALGTKPSMFKVKDNTIRGSPFTKSIKPRFHKNFGEEFRVGSPMDHVLERNAEEQDIMRFNAGTPVYPDSGGLNKTLKEPRTHGYSTPVPQHRPYSRRSLALDEEDSRSIISNMSEDVESFATSAADLADIRTLYDSERPESACSYSSDVSRSFGKPPAVPPKSEKALRRAKRLATRRLKKEVTKTVPDDSCKDALTEASTHAVASPHFSPPVSIAHAPPAGSNVSLSQSEHLAHQCSFHASTHATAPSSHASSLSTSAVPKTIPHVPSSPTLHLAPKPVTQYQVESGFPQSYPVTQRRVLQDIGSGQYYVVDVPVEVKTKTFFDPQTGKYVQLNVRESGRNIPQRQPPQAYPHHQLKSQLQAKSQQQTNGPGNALYQGYPKYPKSYQSAASSSGPPCQSPVTDTQDQLRESINHQYGGPETGYSPEKTPYMDTVNNVDKAHNVVYSARGSQEALSEGDCQIANSRYGPRDIITMSELEDFMEVSDW